MAEKALDATPQGFDKATDVDDAIASFGMQDSSDFDLDDDEVCRRVGRFMKARKSLGKYSWYPQEV